MTAKSPGAKPRIYVHSRPCNFPLKKFLTVACLSPSSDLIKGNIIKKKIAKKAGKKESGVVHCRILV